MRACTKTLLPTFIIFVNHPASKLYHAYGSMYLEYTCCFHMGAITKKIFICTIGTMMIFASRAQYPQYEFNLYGGYAFVNKANFNSQPRKLNGTALGSMSLDIHTSPFHSVEVLYQLDISTPIYRHFGVPVRDKKEGIRVAYIMANEVWHVPLKEKWEWYAAFGPGLGLICIDDGEVLEGLAWDVRSGVKTKLNSWLSSKIQLQLFSTSYNGDGGATPGNPVNGINVFVYQFGVTAGFALKL
jgi:hypothetical protein